MLFHACTFVSLDSATFSRGMILTDRERGECGRLIAQMGLGILPPTFFFRGGGGAGAKNLTSGLKNSDLLILEPILATDTLSMNAII